MLLVPAYGRKYETCAQAQKDFDANKDFRIQGGPYINKQDIIQFFDGKGFENKEIFIKISKAQSCLVYVCE